MSFVSTFLKFRVIRFFLYCIEYRRSKSRLKQITSILSNKGFNSIIDVGCGTGVIVERLQQHFRYVVGFDIADHNLSNKITFIKGTPNDSLPFKENEFDCAILIFVLHHTENIEYILKETQRISKTVLIFEDLIIHPFQKYYTFFIDSLMNFEWLGHPHNNKSDNEWKKIFSDLGYNIIEKCYTNNFLGLKHAQYLLSHTEFSKTL